MPSLLLKLCVAHLAGDYLLQSDQDAANKQVGRVLARHTLVHALTLIVVGLTAPVQTFGLWAGLLLLLLSHAGIDALTSRALAPGIRRLLIDQVLHAAALVLLVLGLAPGELSNAGHWLGQVARQRETWWQLAGLLSAVWLGGVVIGLAVRPYASSSGGTDARHAGLARAGRTIGYCERTLIYVFMVTGSQMLIGFVIAAKALMRLPEARDSGTRETAEYYLVGTLFSFVWAVLIGVLVRAALSP